MQTNNLEELNLLKNKIGEILLNESDENKTNINNLTESLDCNNLNDNLSYLSDIENTIISLNERLINE